MLRVVVALMLVASCSKETAPTTAPRPKQSPFETFGETSPRPGELAPAFELADTAGAPAKLRDEVGRGPVVLVFGSFT